MKHVIATLTLALAASAFAQGGYPVSVEHSAGTTTLAKRPVKVAVLGPYALDLLLSLGVQPAGYAEVSYYKFGAPGTSMTGIPYLGDRVRTKPANLGTREQPSLEAIAALKPDVIVGQDDLHTEIYRQLSRIAPTVLADGSNWREGLSAVAKAFRKEDRAATVRGNIDREIRSLKVALEGFRKTNPKLLLLGFPGLQSGSTPISIGPEAFSGRLFTELGWKPMLSPDQEGNLSLEGIAALDPDVIFVTANQTNTVENARKEWYGTPLLANLSATREKKIYVVPNQLWNRIRGPIAAQLVLRQVRELLVTAKAGAAR